MTEDSSKLNSRNDRSELRFCVLGPVSASRGNEQISVGGEKQRTVLAVLIANAGSYVSADALVEAVWGDEAIERARRNVQTYVSTLRSVLGDCITKTGQGWRLEVAPDQIDASLFESVYQSARRSASESPELASSSIREALSLWAGLPYSDVEAHGVLDGETTRLTELRVAAKALRIDVELALGRDADLVGELESLLVEHPYSERFRAQHMLALYRAGRQQESLRSYTEMSAVLRDELGVDPTPDLQSLEQRILEHDGSLDRPEKQSVSVRAILVADPGDPVEIGHLPTAERDDLLARISATLSGVLGGEGSVGSYSVGITTYAVFESPRAAVAAAQRAASLPNGTRLRFAIDWGDVIVDDGGVSGPTVARAAVMAAAAHGGQIVLSADTQRAIADAGDDAGLSFQALGAHSLRGIEDDVSLYQLLIGDDPTRFPELQTHRAPPPLPPHGGRHLPGYELREVMGQGSVGLLHRAYQPTVGREVLVEVISRFDASDPDFVRRFEADAQRLSLIDHRSIAPIIDHWRQPDGAFVVYRYPRGGLLSDATPADPARVLDQVGSALVFANSLGLVHGSVRPDRVVLDEAGNASLLGFPMAGIAPHASIKHPAYIAPEVLNGEVLTERTDVYSLGVLAQELLGGPLGLDSPVDSGQPAIARALSPDPSERHASVVEFMTELNPVGDASPERRYTESRNPYKGLAAFHESDAADFFGRGEAIDELVESLRQHGVVTVVGPSGIGKSSVVRAGLVPALRMGAIEGSEKWLTTTMIPGSHPFTELQRALQKVLTDLPIPLADALALQSPESLGLIRRVLPGRSDLLIVVDQFEELFTMTGEAERVAFLELVVMAIENGDARFALTLRADFLDGPLRHAAFAEVVKRSTVMLRSPNAEELEEAITMPARRVGVQVESGLTQRIVADLANQPGSLPLLQHTLGQLFENRAFDLIDIAEFDKIGGISGSLGRSADQGFDLLDPEAQEATKQGFLRLVTILGDSPPTRKRLRLNELSDLELGDSLDVFARQRLLVYDSDPETHEPTVEVAHEALLQHWPRLASWIDAARGDLVLAHRLGEAAADWDASARASVHLLSGGRLAQHQSWTAGTSLRLPPQHRELLAASTEHEANISRRRRRVRSATLAVMATVAVLASVFGVIAVRAARTASDSENAAIEAGIAAEASADEAAANAALAADNERAAVDAGELAEQNAEAAGVAADLARARELAASAISVTDRDPELATLLAVESIERAPAGRGVFPEGLISLREAVNANRLLDRLELPAATGAELFPDASAVIVTETDLRRVSKYLIEDNRISEQPVWIFEDATTNDIMRGTLVHPKLDFAVVTVASGSTGRDPGADGEVIDGEDPVGSRLVILDLLTGERRNTIGFNECEELSIGRGKPWFSADGSVLGIDLNATACAQDRGWIGFALLDTTTWTEIARWDFGQVSMTRDMATLLVDNFGGPADIVSYPSLELQRRLDIEAGFGFRSITPDGRIIAVSPREIEDLRPSFWDAETGQLLSRAAGFEGFAGGMNFTPSGLVSLASAERDGIWDPVTGKSVLRLAQSFSVGGSLSGDGQVKVTATPGVGVELWDIGLVRGGSASLTESEAGLIWLNPDGVKSGLALAMWGFTDIFDAVLNQTIAVVDPVTGEVLASRRAIEEFGQLHDGRLVIIPMSDDAATIGPLTVWDSVTGDEVAIQDCQAPLATYMPRDDRGDLRNIQGHLCPNGDPFFGAAAGVSVDGSTIAALAYDSTAATGNPAERINSLLLRTWDAQTLQVLSTVTIQAGNPIQQGALGAVGSGWVMVIEDSDSGEAVPSRIVILETASGNVLARLDGPWGRGIEELSSDGVSLYIAGDDGLIHEFDTSTWTLRRSWPAGVHRARGLAVSPDGRFVAAGGEDDLIAIWQVEDDEPVLVDRIPTGAWASDVAWINDDTIGAALMFSAGNTAWQTFLLDPGAVVADAREGLARDFSEAECNTYSIDPCRRD